MKLKSNLLSTFPSVRKDSLHEFKRVIRCHSCCQGARRTGDWGQGVGKIDFSCVGNSETETLQENWGIWPNTIINGEQIDFGY